MTASCWQALNMLSTAPRSFNRAQFGLLANLAAADRADGPRKPGDVAWLQGTCGTWGMFLLQHRHQCERLTITNHRETDLPKKRGRSSWITSNMTSISPLRFFLVWEFYVILPCCYLAAQSKVHETWKKQFERLSKPGSIASVTLSQDGCGCPFGATTLGFMWTNVGHGPCESHTCVGKCFILSSQGTATKEDAIMLPRSQFGTSSSWFHNVCTWIDCLFVFLCWAPSNSWQSYKIFNCWLKNMENNAPPITKAVDDFAVF